MSLRNLIEARLRLTGRNPHQAARMGGLERSFVRDLLSGKKETVRGDNVRRLAIALDVDEREIMSAMGDDTPNLEGNGAPAVSSAIETDSVSREAFLGFAEAIALDRGFDIEASSRFAKAALASVLKAPRLHARASAHEQARLRALDVLDLFPPPKSHR